MPTLEIQTVSVIPAYNEERTVGNVLRASFLANTVDGVVLVNDGSSDATVESAEKAVYYERESGNDKPFVLVEHIQNLGKAEAMQTGAEIARQVGGNSLKTLIFLDADLSAIRSRETPHNRYLHQVIFDKLIGRQASEFEAQEAGEIEGDLLDLLSGYIDQLVLPVKESEQVMSIGLLARNPLADRFRGKLDWGMLAGSRAVSIELWDTMLQECAEKGIQINGWEIEAALNSYTRLRRDETGQKLNRRIGKLLMTDVVHVGSRYKAGGIIPGVKRMASIHGGALKSFAKFAVKL